RHDEVVEASLDALQRRKRSSAFAAVAEAVRYGTVPDFIADERHLGVQQRGSDEPAGLTRFDRRIRRVLEYFGNADLGPGMQGAMAALASRGGHFGHSICLADRTPERLGYRLALVVHQRLRIGDGDLHLPWTPALPQRFTRQHVHRRGIAPQVLDAVRVERVEIVRDELRR